VALAAARSAIVVGPVVYRLDSDSRLHRLAAADDGDSGDYLLTGMLRHRGQQLQPRPWPRCIWPWLRPRPRRCCGFGLELYGLVDSFYVRKTLFHV